MADPVADNSDFAVDELKRKARRRLVGAVVIALGAATILPLLLEQEQKPLGDDVSVQIPPVDSGKFVSRLKGDKGKDAAPDVRPNSGAIRTAADSGRPAPAPAEPAAIPGGPAPAVVPTPSPAEAGPRPAPTAEAGAKAAAPNVKAAAADTQAETRGAAKPAAKPEARPQPGPDVAAAPPANVPVAGASKAEGYVVQLGAFTDNYGANSLANKLKKLGYAAFTEPVETSRGTLWRVRVGGYPTRQAAVEARNKLKADGHNGVVAAAK